MLKRIYNPLTPLQHLTTVTVFMLAACSLTYVIPPMEELRPWIPGEEDLPIVRLFKRMLDTGQPPLAYDGAVELAALLEAGLKAHWTRQRVFLSDLIA